MLTSSAANSTIINNGPQGGTEEGVTFFFDHSSAGNSIITANPGGYVLFTSHATAANAILIVSGGEIDFDEQSDGGQAQLQFSRAGRVQNIQSHPRTLTIGSLAGEGTMVSGAELDVGSNDLDTTYAGPLVGGALRKIGDGTLILSGVNSYTGGTTVEGGGLIANNTKGSATGTGPVQVNAGTFGGRSKIAGAVTIGSGSGAGAYLAPGIDGPGILMIRNTLTFKADGTYACDLSMAKSKADQVVCKGVTIESGAQFALNARGNQSLPIGTAFMVVENKTHQHTSGTFANLPDHSTLTANGNTFLVDYEGGDGNDLTLEVIQ